MSTINLRENCNWYTCLRKRYRDGHGIAGIIAIMFCAHRNSGGWGCSSRVEVRESGVKFLIQDSDHICPSGAVERE